MCNNANPSAHMRIYGHANGTHSNQRGPCQSLITSPGGCIFDIVLATSHTTYMRVTMVMAVSKVMGLPESKPPFVLVKVRVL